MCFVVCVYCKSILEFNLVQIQTDKSIFEHILKFWVSTLRLQLSAAKSNRKVVEKDHSDQMISIPEHIHNFTGFFREISNRNSIKK